MTKVRIEVDESLKQVLEDVRASVIRHLKRKYHIQHIEIYGNIVSMILAAKYNHNKKIEFEIEKISARRGILKVI